MRVRYLAISACLLFALISCRRPYKLMYQSKSPKGDSIVSVELSSRPPLPGGGFDIVLSSSGQRRTLYTYQNSDVYACFAEVGWSSDSEKVGVLVRDCWHSSRLLAFDTGTGKGLDPGSVRRYVASALRERYLLPPAVIDPIAWAESEDARNRFQFAKNER
jgi:hypothetical protein